jgi:hypothetical protein
MELMEQRTAAVSQTWHHSSCVVFNVQCFGFLSLSPFQPSAIANISTVYHDPHHNTDFIACSLPPNDSELLPTL